MVCKSYLCAALRGAVHVSVPNRRDTKTSSSDSQSFCVHSWTISLSIIVIIHYIIIGGSRSYSVLGNIARGCYCWHEITKTGFHTYIHQINRFFIIFLRKCTIRVRSMKPNKCINFKALKKYFNITCVDPKRTQSFHRISFSELCVWNYFIFDSLKIHINSQKSPTFKSMFDPVFWYFLFFSFLLLKISIFYRLNMHFVQCSMLCFFKY